METVHKYRDMILHLEYHDTRNTLIEQSVIVLIEYIKAMLQYRDSLLIYRIYLVKRRTSNSSRI